jgi:peptidoglycan-associated lipoprotein
MGTGSKNGPPISEVKGGDFLHHFKKGNTMRSIFTLMLGVAFVALVAVGCSSNNSASTPAKSSSTAAKSSDTPADQKPADSSKPADAPATAAAPDQKDVAPLVDAAKNKQDNGDSVTIKAVDATTGKVVQLVFKDIHFDYDKYTIRPEDRPLIKQNASMLSKEPNLKIVIEGNCDERGTTEYNLALGLHRAVAVMQAMEGDGVKKTQMRTKSNGKEYPVDPGHTEEAWAKNRRSEVKPTAG